MTSVRSASPVPSWKKNPTTSILQKPKYNNNSQPPPPLVSPEKKEEIEQEKDNTAAATATAAKNTSETIPDLYIETINSGFGENPDLYKDILKVFPHATERQLRIAYFRRGREILAESGVRGLDEVATVGDVSNMVRLRFQAVSMAYEIVANPAWKAHYLQHGLVSSVVDDAQSVDTNDPVAGSAASVPSRSVVRWNEHVEELLFDREAHEIKNTVPKAIKKKRKTKIVIETAELNQHLKHLDEEAEQHFVADFWDTIEESLDGLIKMAVDIEPSTKKQQGGHKNKSGRDSPSVTTTDTEDTPFDEADNDSKTEGGALFDALGDMFLGRQTPSSDQATSSSVGKQTPISDQATCESGSTGTSGMSKSKPTRQPSPFRPISPEQPSIQPSKSGESDLFDLESINFSAGITNFFGIGGSKPLQEFVDEKNKTVEDKEEDDVFAGLDEEENPDAIAIQQARCSSPTAASVMSDLSESVAPSTTSRRQIETSSPNLDAVEEATTESCDVPFDAQSRMTTQSKATQKSDMMDAVEAQLERMCDATEMMQSLSFGAKSTAGDGDDNDNDNNDEPETEEKSAKSDEGFMEYFIAYIAAIVNECKEMGTNICDVEWDDTILGAFMVNEMEVEALARVVAQEIKKAPAVDAADAVQSPTVVAIQAARSFG